MKYGDFRVSFGTWFSIRTTIVRAKLAQTWINVQTKAWWKGQYKFKSEVKWWARIVNLAYGVWLASQILTYALEGVWINPIYFEVALGYSVASMWFCFYIFQTMTTDQSIKLLDRVFKAWREEVEELHAVIRNLLTRIND